MQIRTLPEFVLGTPVAPKGVLGLDREPNAPSFALPRRRVSGVAVNAGMARILVCAPRKSSKIKTKWDGKTQVKVPLHYAPHERVLPSNCALGAKRFRARNLISMEI